MVEEGGSLCTYKWQHSQTSQFSIVNPNNEVGNQRINLNEVLISKEI